MMLSSAIVLALRELRRNALRASLTTLGIVIGVAAVIALVTLGNGASRGITASIQSLGRALIIVQPGTRRGFGGGGAAAASAAPFSIADAEAIAREIANTRGVAPVAIRNETAVAGNQNHPSQVMGTDNAYFEVRDWPIETGRVFSEAEIRAGRTVCVLGRTVKLALFGGQNPLGVTIRIGDAPCEVVGVLAPKGQSTFGQDQDDIVLMPIRAVHRRIAGNDNVGMLWVGARGNGDVTGVISGISRLLRERRHLTGNTPDDFQVNDMQEITRTMEIGRAHV